MQARNPSSGSGESFPISSSLKLVAWVLVQRRCRIRESLVQHPCRTWLRRKPQGFTLDQGGEVSGGLTRAPRQAQGSLPAGLTSHSLNFHIHCGHPCLLMLDSFLCLLAVPCLCCCFLWAQCTGLSSQQLLLLCRMGSRPAVFSGCGTRA